MGASSHKTTIERESGPVLVHVEYTYSPPLPGFANAQHDLCRPPEEAECRITWASITLEPEEIEDIEHEIIRKEKRQ